MGRKPKPSKQKKKIQNQPKKLNHNWKEPLTLHQPAKKNSRGGGSNQSILFSLITTSKAT